MKKELLGVCPVCSGPMHVKELGCRNCDIAIVGDFELSPFNALPKEDLRFVEIFIRNAGNLRDVQSEMGLSYPTVKKALDNVIRNLGYDVKPDLTSNTTSFTTSPTISDKADADVMGKLKNNEISVEEAITLIKTGKVPV